MPRFESFVLTVSTRLLISATSVIVKLTVLQKPLQYLKLGSTPAQCQMTLKGCRLFDDSGHFLEFSTEADGSGSLHRGVTRARIRPVGFRPEVAQLRLCIPAGYRDPAAQALAAFSGRWIASGSFTPPTCPLGLRRPGREVAHETSDDFCAVRGQQTGQKRRSQPGVAPRSRRRPTLDFAPALRIDSAHRNDRPASRLQDSPGRRWWVPRKPDCLSWTTRGSGRRQGQPLRPDSLPIARPDRLDQCGGKIHPRGPCPGLVGRRRL